MGSISEDFSASIGLPQIKLAELYRVYLRTGAIYYFTSHHKNIAWNGQTYTALPITRDPIQVNLSGEIDEAKVYLAGISGDLVDVLSKNVLDDALVEIVMIVRGSTYGTGQERPIFTGWADLEYNRQFMVLTLRHWIGSLNIQVPRCTYKEACNWSIFESYCGLEQASFSYTGTATGGSANTIVDSTRGILYKASFTGGSLTNTIKKTETIAGGIGGGVAVVVNIIYASDGSGTIWYCELTGSQYVDGETLTVAGGGTVEVSGTPAEDGVFYQRGEARVMTGDNAGERRMILADQSYTITVIHPFPNAVAASVSYVIYPGCDGRPAETCAAVFDNAGNFRGYIYVPRIEEALM